MATRAQLVQERSRLRRDALLLAAVDLFVEGGSRAVTHRAVAKRAGLPPASTTYYFETIEDLLSEALTEHVKRWQSDLARVSREGQDDRAAQLDGPMSAEESTRFIEHVFRVRGPEVVGREIAVLLAVARDERLHDHSTRTMEGLEAFVVRWLSAAGIPDVERLAPGVLALIGGIALRRQTGQYSEADEARMLSEYMRDMICAHLMGREAVDRIVVGGGSMAEGRPDA